MIRRALPLGVSALLVAMLPWFGCASTEPTDTSKPDSSSTLGEASTETDAGSDAKVEVDSGCKPSDPNCVSQVLSCDETAWCPVPTPMSALFAYTSVWGSGSNDVWAVGSGGTIAHYDGTAWALTPLDLLLGNTGNTLRSVWGSGPNDVWAVSRTDVIFHSTGFVNGAATWTPDPGPGKALPEQRTATVVWGTGPNDVRIGFLPRSLGDGYYNQWVKSGGRWRVAKGEGSIFAFWGTTDDLWYVADNSEADGWQRAMTVHGTLDQDGGMKWVSVENKSISTLEGIWGSGPNDLWAVGDNGTIRHLANGATRWDIVSSPTTDALHGIWGSSANDVWAVGDNGTILHFDGTSWKKSSAAFPIGRKPRLAAIWGSSANDVWIVGDAIALHYTGPKPGVQDGQ